MGELIDGEAVARKIKEGLKEEVSRMRERPKLAALLATDNKGAHIYANQQAKNCEEIGIEYQRVERPATSSEEELLSQVKELNRNPTVTGIIVQLPLPEGVNARCLQWQIAPAKDVEGVTPANQGRMIYAPQPFYKRPEELPHDDWLDRSLSWPLPVPAPCTAVGAMMLIRSLKLDLYGMEAVVVGHSEIFGKPMSLLLMAHFCTTTVCHIATRGLPSHTRRAEILIVGVGKPGLITADMIRPGAIVIDVGINRVAETGPDGKRRIKTVGDVDFEEARKVAGYITPVPGGVGPMTTAVLLRSTVEAAKASMEGGER
jgi:methylenetetrahydrofolate dehydrogenase (NADP+)/methenyltetrahydrofolate cyclohydrolase